MKQLCFFLAVLFTLCTNAQTPGTKISLNEKTIVKDSSGTIYPYVIWQKLLQTGEYNIKALNINADPPEFLLVRLNEAEMKARDERMPKPRESAYFRTGTNISNAKLVTLDKKKYNLKDLAGKVVVLNFWFINCPPCRMEIPHLNKMTETYKGREDVIFLAVALDEAYELKNFLKEMPFNYGIVDGGRYIASQYGITSYPTHVVLDKEGKVAFHTSGYGMETVPWLKKSIDAALGGKP
ncbi:TlpA disulfide reductase family protein [Sediminibacterium sp.]|uniref:TlpA family protein disulfide reductase n=1 Tax=Sediminibacterium sp. TaxID=1917865 RepID=UPI0025D4D902|nr:TlpA disulfide reductase family protein [Sediminibacterium sp.]MBW0178120.1 TlpA family protein disulfide reductase [Sediminibacterium sp.]